MKNIFYKCKFNSVLIKSRKFENFVRYNQTTKMFDQDFYSSIDNKQLLNNSSFINNRFLPYDTSEAAFDVKNPAFDTFLAKIFPASQQDIHSAVDAAQTAFKQYRTLTAKTRAALLREVANLHHKHLTDLAKIITYECGKNFNEAKGEILYAAGYYEWFAEEAKRVYGDLIPGNSDGRKIMVTKEPLGVCGLIAPWNFPNAMISRKVAAALSVGCTVVIKPAAETPLSCLALCQIFSDAANQVGISIAGIINAVPVSKENASKVSQVFMERNDVRKLSFTGSTKVGIHLYEKSAKTLKKLSLELGGNAPFIVFDDADLEKAAEGLMLSKFRNSGQTCVCANRIFVQKNVEKRFVSILSERVSKLKVGFGMEKNVQIGPLINDSAVEKCVALIDDAKKKGARLICGGKKSHHDPSGFFFEPTILENASDDMRLATEEIFGPVIAIYTFDSEEEAVRRANSTDAGLAAYFFAKDAARIFRVNDGLDYGIVGVNTGLVSTEVAPFGGMKHSGFGREGSKYGIEDYITLKYTALNYAA